MVLVAALFSLADCLNFFLSQNYCPECLSAVVSVPALSDAQHHAGELGQPAAAARSRILGGDAYYICEELTPDMVCNRPIVGRS